MPTSSSLSPKVTAGAGGASLAGPLVVVILWAFHLEPPSDVVASLTAVVSALLGFGAAYVTPHSPPPATGA